ncbi:hypothetical protein M3Y97_00272700 [Aphelenchoides bicaudatus]|nr:hypothetical protein M3Y97_00272700 [Aphelenchoides bicaudatus]
MDAVVMRQRQPVGQRRIGASCKQRPAMYRYRSLMSVDNLNSGPKLRNEFYYPQRQSVCATFTLERPEKLATILSPKSPGLVSQHKNSAFTSNTSLNQLNSRSMSSHQLLNQLNQQQVPLTTSASSTTLNGIEVATSTEFPANQQDLSRNPMPVLIEEQTAEQQNLDSQDAMVESVHAKTATLADKLSRSFFDLTQGSQDRLAKWKSKLQQYGQGQRQRSSEKEPSNITR